MLTSSDATRNILLTADFVLAADLFKITMPNGTVLRWSGGDRDFTVSSESFLRGPLIKRTKTKRKVGVDSDTINITIMDDGSITLNNRSLLRAIHEGEFEGSIVEVRRMFLSSWDDTSPGYVSWFTGVVSEVSGDQGRYELKVKDMLALLDTPMPRRLYQPSCNNTWADSNCGVNKTTYTKTGTITGAPTDRVLALSSGIANYNVDGYYELGVAKLTSGVDAQLARTIRQHAGGQVTLAPCLPKTPASGDSLTIYPSCPKTRDICTSRYANLPKFGGFPYVPTPETMYKTSQAPSTGTPQGGVGRAPSGSPNTNTTYAQ